MPRKLTREEFEKKIEGRFILLGEFDGLQEKTKFKHIKCGNEIEVKPSSVSSPKKDSCYKCPNYQNKTIDQYKEEINALYKGEYTILAKEYLGNKTKLLTKHNACGHEYNVRPNDILRRKLCPRCANINRGKTKLKVNYLEELIENAEDGIEYEWLEEYDRDNKKKLLIRHKTCNHTYKVKPNDFQQGYRCPKCNNTGNSSKVQLIKDIIEREEAYYFEEIPFSTFRLEGINRFDFVIERTILEFDGKQHFGKDMNYKFYDIPLKNIRERDLYKNNEIKKIKRYNFIRIPYIISEEDLNKMIIGILNAKLPMDVINKYSIMVKPAGSENIINEKEYYDKNDNI